VDGLSLSVYPGEVVGFLGPNGAGKTTTVGMIAGLLRPDEGRVSILGRSAPDPESRRGVGFLVGPPAHWTGLSGRDHVVHALRIQRESGWAGHGGHAGAGPDELLESVGLGTRDGRRAVREYSQGMRQRLSLAMALAGNPSVLVLDEPTNGLDPLGGPEIWALLRELAGRGVALLVSTHLLLEVERYCDRAPMLVRGRLAHEDVLSVLRDGTRSRATEMDFLSEEDARRAAEHWSGAQPQLEVGSGGRLVVRVPGDQIPELLRALALAGLRLPRRVAPVESSLLELFQELTRHQGGA
jgi:ABC-2 type transport system ATP-binding protein